MTGEAPETAGGVRVPKLAFSTCRATPSALTPSAIPPALARGLLAALTPGVVALANEHLAATLASQPGDAILSEVSKGGAGGEGGEGSEDRSIGAVVQRLGAAGLARGLQARTVHVGLIVTVQLVLYDTLKHAFGVP